MQMKHAVTTSADMSSLGGCEMQWMSQDEGSDRRSRSLVRSSVMGVEDARMTSVKEREIGWCENLSRADECSSLVKLSRFMSVVLSRSVPNAKSHIVARIQTPSPSPRRHLSEVPRPDQSHKSVPIISNWTQWAPSHCTPSHPQNFSQCSRP